MIDLLNEKLKNHLNNFSYSSEKDALYLMVELRKYLDRLGFDAKSGRFEIIRFYADWVVHTSKDKITPTIKNVMDSIAKEFENHRTRLLGNKQIKFISMDDLKQEIKEFLKLKGVVLPTQILEEDNWNNFTHSMSNVLADQPINKPNDAIDAFWFEATSPGAIVWNIKFRELEKPWRSVNILV